MSSGKYAAELHPDSCLRRLVASSSLVSLLAGAWVLGNLPVDPILRWLAVGGWVGYLVAVHRRRQVAEERLQRIRVHADGSVAIRAPGRAWLPATLGRDSVVLERVAWVRLRLANGRKHAELLRGDVRDNEDWRRFQVIWRHLPKRPPASPESLGSGS